MYALQSGVVLQSYYQASDFIQRVGSVTTRASAPAALLERTIPEILDDGIKKEYIDAEQKILLPLIFVFLMR